MSFFARAALAVIHPAMDEFFADDVVIDGGAPIRGTLTRMQRQSQSYAGFERSYSSHEADVVVPTAALALFLPLEHKTIAIDGDNWRAVMLPEAEEDGFSRVYLARYQSA